jgi:predicted transcriptional regulator
MILTIECNATEYNVLPPKENEKNIFAITEKAVVISFCDSKEKVIEQSEISSEDAIKLAKFILQYYAIQN